MEILPYHISRPLCFLMFFISLVSAESKSEILNQTIAEEEGSSDSTELSHSLLPQVTWRLEYRMWWRSRHGVSHVTIFHHLMNFFILQTPLKSCPATPVKRMATPHPRKMKPAILVSPVTAVANDSSATTDMQGHVDNALSMVRLVFLMQMQIKSYTIQSHWLIFFPPYLQTPKAVKQKKSGKNEVKAAGKKQVTQTLVINSNPMCLHSVLLSPAIVPLQKLPLLLLG